MRLGLKERIAKIFNQVFVGGSSFLYMNRSTSWSELWLGKAFQKSRVVHHMMWHGGLNLVQSCKMWCSVCILTHSHKSEPHRPI